jgi:hypothetical protein
VTVFLCAPAGSSAQQKETDQPKSEAPADETEPAAEEKPAAEGDAAPAEEMTPDAEAPAEGEMPANDGEPASDDQPVPEPVEPPAEEPEEEESGPELPAGYKPPGVRPEQMRIEKELMTAEEEARILAELKKENYKEVLRNGELDAASTELLKKLARYEVYRMTMKNYRRELHKLRDELFGHVTNAASLPGNQQADAFRAVFLQEIVNRCRELLDGNFYVRNCAALTLAHLNLKDADFKQPAVPFAPAFPPLMEIINSDDQHEAVKIPAIVGIHRISSAGLLTQTERLELAKRAVAELKNPKSGPWYQMRLAEALGRIDLAVDRESRPFIVQALTEVVADRGRHWVVRSMAAKSLGRAKMTGNVNLNKVVFEIAQLAREMIDVYNKERETPDESSPNAKRPESYFWQFCFVNLYLAFQPENANERNLKFGLMQNGGQYKPVIESAYALIAPLARHVLYTKPAAAFPEGRGTSLDKWLKQYAPDSQSIAPNMPAIVNSQASDPSPRQ